jgi:radical SAM protein with 4Fe4S-binding SPASM domain
MSPPHHSPAAPPAAPPLRLVFWETTTACNLTCRHCRRLEPQAEPAAGELDTDAGRALIDGIARTGRPVLIYSGGEPLMRADVYELLDHAAAVGLPTALATNGTLVNRHVARLLSESALRRVAVSLDGADAATHDAFRGIEGSFRQAVEGLGHLRDAGIETQINVTVSRHNAKQLEAMYDLAVRLGAAALHAFLLVPVGCGVELAASQQLTATEYEDVLRRFHALSRRGKIETRATCAPHYNRIAAQREETTPGPLFAAPGTKKGPGVVSGVVGGCLAGSAVCFVSHRGEVFPCGYLPLVAGNVIERSLAEIWTSSPLFQRLRDRSLLTGKCGRCEFRSVCGGCRARAYAATGDEMAEEPYCIHQPHG